MSDYDNDPRVAVQDNGTFDITDQPVVGHVCPGQFGGWVVHTAGVDDVDGAGFDTPDEAIRSLIGPPQ